MSERASAVAAAGAKETASGNGEKDAKERGWVVCVSLSRKRSVSSFWDSLKAHSKKKNTQCSNHNIFNKLRILLKHFV